MKFEIDEVSVFLHTKPKSLERSPVVGDCYGTGIEIRAGFGPIGSTEKKVSGPIMSNFEDGFFLFSGA